MQCNLLNAHSHLILDHAAVLLFHSCPLPPGQCRHARLHVSWGDRSWICPSVTGELLQSYPEGLKLIPGPHDLYTGLNLGKWSSWLPLTFLVGCFTFNSKLAPLQAWGQGKMDAWGNTVRKGYIGTHFEHMQNSPSDTFLLLARQFFTWTRNLCPCSTITYGQLLPYCPDPGPHLTSALRLWQRWSLPGTKAIRMSSLPFLHPGLIDSYEQPDQGPLVPRIPQP